MLKFVNCEHTFEELNKSYLPVFILTDFSQFHLQVIDEWEAGFPKIDGKVADTDRLEQLLDAHYQPQRVVFQYLAQDEGNINIKHKRGPFDLVVQGLPAKDRYVLPKR